MGNVFKFKQFDVDQSGCAMKINTDGVLLGAFASHHHAKHILDIGTGTGVIAMMLAQRFPGALIDAVEIDEQASVTANKNFYASTFSDRLTAHYTALEDFTTEHKYDLIISNPPFFVNDLKNTEDRKSRARHTELSFFETILLKSANLLTTGGLLWLILPVKQADFTIDRSGHYNLFLQREISICSDIHKPVIRKIICFGRSKEGLTQEQFYIYQDQGIHTKKYKALLSNFFLAF
ncbi:tRNA1(Val) (adenine(37)-N6)-methyltransferase [Pedobacter sp. PWIIR3]